MSQKLADLITDTDGRITLRTWLKSYSYTKRLLVGESGDPWESASRYLAYFSQAQGLLKPDVAVLEVGELFDAWLQRNQAVRGELAGKRKLSFPLRRLLEQPQPRELLAEIIDAVLAQIRGQVPLILAMPSPVSWFHQANRASGREEVEPDQDSIEDCAMYIADLARAVSGAAVGGLLLEESPLNGTSSATDVELYRPLLNVTKHYRWPLVLKVGEGGVADNPALQEVDVLIGGGELPAVGSAQGIDVSMKIWLGQPASRLQPKQFYFIDIPKNAMPEHVLESLSTWRADGA